MVATEQPPPAGGPDPEELAGEEAGVEVQVAVEHPALPAHTDFDGWVAAVLALSGEAQPVQLGIRIVGEAEGAELNSTWRGKAGATNVLAFPGPELVPAGLPVRELGDIVICLPLVFSEAAAQNKAPLAHLAHLCVHGLLHLLGYTHDEAAAATAMETLETRVLRGLGFADPYASDDEEG